LAGWSLPEEQQLPGVGCDKQKPFTENGWSQLVSVLVNDFKMSFKVHPLSD